MSKTVSAGFAIVSPNTHLVFSLKAAFNSSSVESGSTKVTSIPSFFMVTPKRLNVPPYTLEEQTKWSPALQILNIE